MLIHFVMTRLVGIERRRIAGGGGRVCATERTAVRSSASYGMLDVNKVFVLIASFLILCVCSEDGRCAHIIRLIHILRLIIDDFRPEEQLACWQTLLIQDDSDPYTHYNVGTLQESISTSIAESDAALNHLLRSADLEIAHSSLGHPLHLVPSYYALRQAAKIYERYGNTEAAIGVLERAFVLHPTAIVAHDIAVLHFHLWHINETMHYIHTSLAVIAGDDERLICIRDAGVMYARMGQRALAASCFLQAFSLQNGDNSSANGTHFCRYKTIASDTGGRGKYGISGFICLGALRLSANAAR